MGFGVLFSGMIVVFSVFPRSRVYRPADRVTEMFPLPFIATSLI
jgi:hypothetical protein